MLNREVWLTFCEWFTVLVILFLGVGQLYWLVRRFLWAQMADTDSEQEIILKLEDGAQERDTGGANNGTRTTADDNHHDDHADFREDIR